MKMSDKNLNLLDVLLDQDNNDPIILMAANGEEFRFDQVAVIPHEVKEQTCLFAVLKPIDEMEGIADDEALVFRIVEDAEGEPIAVVEEDEMIAIEVFNKYYDLLEEVQLGKKKKK